MKCGYPIGTRVRMKNGGAVVEKLRGKEAVVATSLKDYSDIDYGYGYFLHVDGIDKLIFAEEWLIEFVAFQVPLQNWCRNKIDMLYVVDPTIAFDLGQEDLNPYKEDKK